MAESQPAAPSAEPVSNPRCDGALFAGLLGGPVAWLIGFQIAYSLVPWVCSHGHRWLLHLTYGLCFLLALGAGLLSWRLFRRAGPQPLEETEPGIPPRQRFLALLGMMTGVLFALVILAQDLAVLVIDPCAR